MPSFQTKRLVRHGAAQMFDLVADVESYPQFLPLCTGLRVRRRVGTHEGVETIIAEMQVGYKAIRESFTSRVSSDRPRLRILVEYVDGPFSHLENTWTFTERLDGGCEVGFSISYEFASRTLGLLMGAMFDTAFRKFSEAFEHRADEIYR